MEFNRISWYFTLSICSSSLVKMELKCHFSHSHWLILSHPLPYFSDSAGSVQFISHRSRYLPPGGSLLPHTLLLLSPWWPERGIRGGGGGRRCQHRSRLQWEEGAGHLLCHVGGGGGCHAVLVRRRIQTSLSATELLFLWQHTSRLLGRRNKYSDLLLK